MRNSLLIVIFISALTGCQSSDDKNPNSDTTTAGEITIVADESYRPLVQVQIDTFMELYKYAKINVKYLPETEVFNELLNNDSIRIAIVSRKLTDDEVSFFESKRIIPRTLKIAEDAVAFIVNKENADTNFTFEQIHDIMNGKTNHWKQINAGGINDSIRIVFDRSGSSNARFIHEKFLDKKNFPSNIYATNSNTSVINYVSSNKGAIGVIGLNWISDRDDSLAGSFLEKVNVVAIAMPDTGQQKEFNKPFQAYIALKQYPLIRDVLIVSREGRSGLGTGFAAFVAGDKGQRLVRLMGLLPATMPIRIIQIK